MKTLLSIILCFVTSISYSQWILTPDGLASAEDSVKNYVVYEYDGINQVDLYKSVLFFIHENYRSPKDVLSEIPPETITFRGFQPESIGVPRRNKTDRKILGRYQFAYDLSYNITIQFKENRIRINKPFFECTTTSGGKKVTLPLSGKKKSFFITPVCVFSSKDGSVVEPDIKTQIETVFNRISIGVKNAPIAQIENDSEW